MASIIAPAYVDDYHHAHVSSNRGALIRQPPPVVEEPVIEHEHHHLHHHIDHGSVGAPRSVIGGSSHSHRPSVGRQYSYDDLDVRERRYSNGVSVSHIHHAHAHDGDRRRRRHRHRHRSGRFEHETTRYSRSDIDLALHGGEEDDYYHHDDVTIVDVPAGTRRLMINTEKSSRRDYDVDWRREQGIRRSRGLGNELWTEITKDLVSREALEDMGYQFEETDYFYYVFEYLDKEEISELRELTEDIRRERVRELQYESISQAGGSRMGSTPRIMASGGRSGYERDLMDTDTRTEIIIEGSSRGGGRSYRRGRYYN